MLVLSRNSQESVVFGNDDGLHRPLKVTVLEIRGDRVKLGFEVDPDVPDQEVEMLDRLRAAAGQTC